MTTEVEIVNLALDLIGEAAITALADASRPARAATRLFSLTRDQLLRSYNWKFAITRATLDPDTDMGDPIVPEFGFARQYSLPVDCLRFIGIWSDLEPQQNYTSNPEPHKIELGKILTDITEDLPIFYVAQVTTTASFDPLFIEALVYDLAVKLAYALSTGTDRVEQLTRDREKVVRRARLCSAIEGQPEILIASEWLDARANGRLGAYDRAWSSGLW